MTQAKHTPLPWKVQNGGGTNTELLIVADKGQYVPHFNGQAVAALLMYGETRPHEANAAFIVCACNLHYELLEALKLLLKWEGTSTLNGIGIECETDELEEAKSRAAAAIAKAEGGAE